MAGAIQDDVAELAGLAAEGVLLGVFLVLDIAALYILVRRRKYQKSINKPMVFAAVIMFLLSMAQFVVDTTNIFMGFTTTPDRQSRQEYFSDLTVPIYAARHAIYFTMMIVGDAIAIYRCYVVWSRNLWVVIFPILCSLGSAACAYQTIWAIRQPTFTRAALVLERNMGFVIFSLSFAANAVATSLIAYRIYKAERQLKKTMSMASTRRSLLPTARIIIESGAINSAYLLAYTITLRSGSSGLQIMASIVTPLVGVIFAMVIIRAALAADREAAGTTLRNQISTEAMFAQPSTIQEGSVHWMGVSENPSTEKMPMPGRGGI